MDKKEEILNACEKVLNGIEDNSISGLSALMLCKKIARLSEDTEAIVWLDYESSGYPNTKDGNHVDSKAFEVACEHKRGYYKDNEQYIFVELISELDELIESYKHSINSFSTNGASVAGEHAYVAMNSLVHTVNNSVAQINKSIKKYERYKSILINEFYTYAHKKQIELLFGNYTLSIFEEYQKVVNNYFNEVGKETLLKLNAIQEAMKHDNSEFYSQALNTCRKMFLEVSCDLFNKVFPNYDLKTYKTLSGKTLDISGEHSINKLSAIIEKLEGSSANKTITGSNLIYLVDLLTNIADEQSNGVHNDLSKTEANRCIIQTYIALGSIISLYIESTKIDS